MLPNGVESVVSIEAGIADPWFRFVGLDGKAVAMDRFGMSASGAKVMETLGMTSAKVVEAAESL